MSGRKLAGFTLLLLTILASCQKPVGTVCAHFSFSVGDEPLEYDTCKYVNAAGNTYEVQDVQFFVSEVWLKRSDGRRFRMGENFGVHYVDKDIPESLTWSSGESIPVGRYNEVSFVFGLDDGHNISQLFPNAPENNMSWPASLGGGYHYMKINGKWKNENGDKHPFALHLGAGMGLDETGTLWQRIDNSFIVTLPLADFYVSEGESTTLNLNMDVNQWFENPELYDFNVYGGSIMQYQPIQELFRSNGWNVFSMIP